MIKVTCLVIYYEDQNNYGITKPIRQKSYKSSLSSSLTNSKYNEVDKDYILTSESPRRTDLVTLRQLNYDNNNRKKISSQNIYLDARTIHQSEKMQPNNAWPNGCLLQVPI